MKPQRIISGLLALILSFAAQSSTVDLVLRSGNAILSADTPQNTYIKIALNGTERAFSQRRRAALNVAIVIDRSGSMQGQKLAQAKRAAIDALQHLQSSDVLSIISYSDRAVVEWPAQAVTDRQSLIMAIQGMRAQGSTALFAGVSRGAAELREYFRQQRVNRVILLSDGIANVGPSSASDLASLGRSLSREGISVTTIGLGLGYNEDLMVALAGNSDGNHVFAENPAQLESVFAREFGDITTVVAQDLNIIIQCPDGVQPLRVLGRDAEIIGNQVRTRLNQVYGGQEKYLLLEVAVPSGRAGSKQLLATANLSYLDAIDGQRHNRSQSLSVSFSRSQNAVKNARDADTLSDALQQEANIYSQEAVEMRDRGDVSGARAKLEAASEYLRDTAKSLDLPASAVAPAAAAYESQAEAVEDDANWNRQRKQLKADQYRLEKQQQ